MPKTLGIWEWGCPKRGGAQNAVTPEFRLVGEDPGNKAGRGYFSYFGFLI